MIKWERALACFYPGKMGFLQVTGNGKKCRNWEWDKKNCYHDPLTHHLFPGVKKRQILFKHLFSVHFILACWDPACAIFPWRSSISSQRYLCTAVHVRPKVYRALTEHGYLYDTKDWSPSNFWRSLSVLSKPTQRRWRRRGTPNSSHWKSDCRNTF